MNPATAGVLIGIGLSFMAFFPAGFFTAKRIYSDEEYEDQLARQADYIWTLEGRL